MSRVVFEAVSLEAVTVPDQYRDEDQPQHSLPYQRVTNLSVEGGGLSDEVELTGLPNLADKQTEHRNFQVTSDFAANLLNSARNLNDYRGSINCHAFSRLMTDFRSVANECWDPITGNIAGKPSVSSLPLGSVGLIGVATQEGPIVAHSVIGLGEDETESLQALSTASELAIVDNDVLVDYYQRYFDRAETGLYMVNDEDIARLQEEALAHFAVEQAFGQ